jgi:hypothetical protein
VEPLGAVLSATLALMTGSQGSSAGPLAIHLAMGKGSLNTNPPAIIGSAAPKAAEKGITNKARPLERAIWE